MNEVLRAFRERKGIAILGLFWDSFWTQYAMSKRQ